MHHLYKERKSNKRKFYTEIIEKKKEDRNIARYQFQFSITHTVSKTL